MSRSAVTFSIETEVAPTFYEELLNYTYKFYIQPSSQRFTNVKQNVADGVHILDFTFLEPKGNGRVDLSMKSGNPIEVTMVPSGEDVPQSVLDRLKDDIIIAVQYFEEYVRRSTLYFAWVQGRDVVPEKSPLRRARIIERILLGNILFLFVLLYAVSIALFFFIGLWAAIVIVFGQFLAVVFASKILGGMGDWPITKENQTVHILQYHLPPEERASFHKKYTRDRLMQIKKEIYDRSVANGKPVDVGTCAEVMTKFGIQCKPENMSTKVVNVHELIMKTTEKYGLPRPKVVLSNTMVPNAAASGPSPSRGLVLITTGLLVQLDEEEILSVLGHELSHLKSRDPFILFGMVGGEYLLRVFVLWPYIQFFGILYLLIVFGLIFFVAKFFEARADLESAIKIGDPKVLAEALRKIGFRRLQFERSPASRIQDWITWDPHPPIYFRVERLEKIEQTREVKHTLIQSAKDCIRGFFAAF